MLHDGFMQNKYSAVNSVLFMNQIANKYSGDIYVIGS